VSAKLYGSAVLSLPAEAWVHSQAIPYEICGDKSGIATLMFPIRFSIVSINPPLLSITSFICHQRYTYTSLNNALNP